MTYARFINSIGAVLGFASAAFGCGGLVLLLTQISGPAGFFGTIGVFCGGFLAGILALLVYSHQGDDHD